MTQQEKGMNKPSRVGGKEIESCRMTGIHRGRDEMVVVGGSTEEKSPVLTVTLWLFMSQNH